MRPPFDEIESFWRELLRSRSLPATVRWVFYEDKARVAAQPMDPYFAFRLRPAVEAERIARFACGRLNPKLPLAIVAYAVHGDLVVTGLQGDLFLADEDIYREDWNIYFDAREHLMDRFEIVSDAAIWAQRQETQPHFLSELDYLVSVDALRRQIGYRA